MDRPSSSDDRLLRILPARIRALLWKRQELHRSLVGMIWLLLQVGLDAVLGVAVGIWVARYLGPADYGVLSYTVAIVSLLSPLSSLGLGPVVVRELVRDPKALPSILGTTALLRAVGSLALVLSSVVAIRGLRPESPGILGLVTVVAIAHGLRNLGVVELWFQANAQIKYIALSRAGAAMIGAGLRVGLIVVGAALPLFVVAYGIHVALPALGVLIFYRIAKARSPGRWRADAVRARQLLREGWPLMFAGLMSFVYMKVDQVMIGELRGDHEVGMYSAAVRLSEAFHLLPNLVLIAVFPSLVKAQAISAALYEERFQRLYDAFVWFAIGAGLVMQVAAAPLIGLLYGASYAGSGPVLAIHIWSGVFWFSGSAGHRYLIAESRTGITLFMTTCGALTNVLLNLLWIERFGAIGAAYATLGSFAVSHWLSAAFFAASRPMLWFFVRAFNPIGLIHRWRQLG